MRGKIERAGDIDCTTEGGFFIGIRFDALAWNRLEIHYRCCDGLRDAHDGVLGTLEAASILLACSSDVLDFCHSASWVRPLLASKRHGIRDKIVGQVHILLKNWAQTASNEPILHV